MAPRASLAYILAESGWLIRQQKSKGAGLRRARAILFVYMMNITVFARGF
jgi:hypothetical protein